MKKYIFLFFVLVCFPLFAEINDQIKLLKDEDAALVKTRIAELESNFKVKIILVTSKDEIDTKKMVRSNKQTIIIRIIKPDNAKKMRVGVDFTKDINIFLYKDEISRLLDEGQTLVDDKQYVDLILELTGNLAEIVNMINEDEKASKKEGFINKVKIFLVIMVILLFVFVVTMIINKIRNISICKHCDIEMDLIEEIEEGNKSIKIYKCHVCGHSVRVSKRY